MRKGEYCVGSERRNVAKTDSTKGEEPGGHREDDAIQA
jgi:hypothetical protein